jgi:Kef-type K+ transport system membrane component KefB
MAAILTAARLMAVAFRFIGQPAVIGEMTAGILLGPSLLGRISPLYALSQLGLVLFMFLVGLEVRPGSLRGLLNRSL